VVASISKVLVAKDTDHKLIDAKEVSRWEDQGWRNDDLVLG
jgi:hypothetical protein